MGTAGDDEPVADVATTGSAATTPAPALAAAYGRYTEGFTTPDLMDAKAFLESLA